MTERQNGAGPRLSGGQVALVAIAAVLVLLGWITTIGICLVLISRP